MFGIRQDAARDGSQNEVDVNSLIQLIEADDPDPSFRGTATCQLSKSIQAMHLNQPFINDHPI
jgi:hypothetical protein